jgi:hypothetical protein
MIRTTAMLLLSACLLLLTAMPAQGVPGEGAWMYGVVNSPTVRIMQYNPLLEVNEEIFDTGFTSFANSLAFDPVRDHLFFQSDNSGGDPSVAGLYYFGISTGTLTKIATLAEIGSSNLLPWSAAFYDGGCFWRRRRGRMCVCVCTCTCTCAY